MRSVALGAAILAASAGVAAGVAPPVVVPTAAPGCAATLSPFAETRLTAMINQTRRSEGVAKVARHAALRSAGQVKSVAMADGAVFAHKLPWADGRPAGQNIAMASSPAAAYGAMLKSPGHRRILVDRVWRYTGIGAAVRCDGMLFVTINMMAPRA